MPKCCRFDPADPENKSDNDSKMTRIMPHNRYTQVRRRPRTKRAPSTHTHRDRQRHRHRQRHRQRDTQKQKQTQTQTQTRRRTDTHGARTHTNAQAHARAYGTGHDLLEGGEVVERYPRGHLEARQQRCRCAGSARRPRRADALGNTGAGKRSARHIHSRSRPEIGCSGDSWPTVRPVDFVGPGRDGYPCALPRDAIGCELVKDVSRVLKKPYVLPGFRSAFKLIQLGSP